MGDNKNDVLNYLYNINAFVVDIDILKELQTVNDDSVLRSHRRGITFGIFNQSIDFEKFLVRLVLSLSQKYS